MFEQETSPTQTRRFMGFWLTELELNIAGKSRQGFLPAPRPQCTGGQRIPPLPLGVIDPWGPADPCHGRMGRGCPCHLALGTLCPAGAPSCPLHDSQALCPSPPLCNAGQAFKASALQQRAPRAVLVCPAVTSGCTGMKWEGNTPGVTAQLAGPTGTVRLSLHPTTGPIHPPRGRDLPCARAWSLPKKGIASREAEASAAGNWGRSRLPALTQRPPQPAA